MNAASRASQIFFFQSGCRYLVIHWQTCLNFKSSDFKFQIMIYFTK